MIFEKLGQYCSLRNGYAFKSKDFVDDGTPVIRISDIRNGVVTTKTAAKIKPSNKYENFVIKKGAILIAMSGATTGKLGRYEEDAIAYQNQRVGCFIPDETILKSDYLYFVLRSYQDLIKNKAYGGAQPNISGKALESLRIPVPSTDNQIRIATLLRHVETLIATRINNLQQLDDFLKSTFLEMFGDPVRNEKGWDTATLESLVADDCPLTYGIVQPGDDFPNGIPVVRPVDLTDDLVFKSDLKNIDPKIDKKFKRTRLKGGELLICVRGTTGVISIASDELEGANVTRGLTPIWFDSSFDKIFALHQIKSIPIQKNIQEKTYGVALKQINLKELRLLSLINPPKDAQIRFSDIAIKTQALKLNYRKNLHEMENLYGVLCQKAFKGELDLSRVPLPEPEPKVYQRTLTDQIKVTDDVISFVEYPMSAPEERKKLLRNFFDEFLKKHKGENLSLEDFWQKVDVKTIDIIDEFDKAWGVEDYDQVKDWVFELIHEGKLEQSFVLSTDSPPDGQIELRIKG